MAPTSVPTQDITEVPASLRHIPFTNTLKFYLNGQLQTVRNPDPELRLIDWIRDEADLIGTKEACSESGCNACSVCVAYMGDDLDNPGTKRIHFKAINSCVTPLVLVDGKHLITTEGLGTSENPHPVQERIAKFHGSQCGFCTPGFVMALYSLLREKHGHVSVEDIDESLESNLCRCTGYMPIYDAAYSFAYDSDNYNKRKVRPYLPKPQSDDPSSLYGGSVCALGDKCCRAKKNKPANGGGCCGGRSDGTCCKDKKANGNGNSAVSNSSSIDGEADGKAEGKADGSASTPYPDTEIDMNKIFTPYGLEMKPYDADNDKPFPLKVPSEPTKPILYGNERKVYYRPVSKQQMLEIYHAYPDAKIIGGASEVLIEVKFKNSAYPVNIYANDVPELIGWSYEEGKGLTIGGNFPLIDLERLCDKLCEKYTDGRQQVYYAIAHQLKLFASKAVRNVATAAGNVVTASPIADLNPILVACGAILTAERLSDTGAVETTEVDMRDDFFTGYRQHKLPPHSIVTKIFIPDTQPYEFIHSWKQCKRKDDDISIVTSCLRAQLDKEGNILDSTFVYGGMAPITKDSKKTQAGLKGKSIFDADFSKVGCALLATDYPLPYGVPGGAATYRRTLTLSFFFKFWQYMLDEMTKNHPEATYNGVSTETIREALLDTDSIRPVTRTQKHGYRDLEVPGHKTGIMGKPIVHVNAMKQACGEAQYTDDIPPFHREVFGAQVMSTRAHAKIVSIDWSGIYDVEGVIGYIDVNDLPNEKANYWGPLDFGKEPFLATDEVHYFGQTIGVVLAENKLRAYEATRKVVVEYEDLPHIITVEDGYEQKSFFPDSRETKLGDWETAFKTSAHYIEGTARLSAQEHFYFEVNNCVVVPEESGELKVYSSTQNPNECQEYCAQAVGVPSNRVVVRTKKLGGGFGGKETRSVLYAALSSIAARKFNRPVRMQLRRDEDMRTSGERHPFLIKYRASMDDDMKFTGMEVYLYANAGWSMDLTRGVIDRSVLHASNAYYFPNAHVCGIPVKTNIASNTAYRSFGAQAGFFAAETIVERFAEKLNVDPELIRRINYYRPNAGETTHFKQKITEDISIANVVAENLKEAQYDKLKAEVDEFNAKHRWIKRGIAQTPSVFGVSFGVLFLNQGGALVNIYADGSCLISTGGVEIGQGISTVMRMIAANELGIPFEKVFLSETSTQCVPNASATAASAGSDLNGMAVQRACQKINERLQPLKDMLSKKKGDYTWDELIETAYLERTSLSATGFYKTPDIGYVINADNDNPNPKPAFLYHTQGSALSVVEVDTLTGEWAVLESHLKMNCGKPLNQAIIYGQIEGAFIQGMGYFTMEQSLWMARNGMMATSGPGTYKIPGFRDIPQRFVVSMYQGEYKHLKTIHSSKGVGEPPFFLGASVYFAIRHAIAAARKSNGVTEPMSSVPFRVPLSCERIRVFCDDEIVQAVDVQPKDNEQPFFIEG